MASSLLRRLMSQPQTAAALLQACSPAPAAARPCQLVQLAALSASAAAAAAGKLYGACVLERLPVVVPETPAWELEFFQWQASVRAKYMRQLPPEFTDVQESEAKSEASSYEPAPRETEADRTNDRQSLKRRLDQRLFLLVRPKGGSWALMQRENAEGETMRQTAERALADAVDTSAVQPYFVGNAPAGHVQLGDGTTFFHRCQLIQGVPALKGSSGYSEFVWVAKDELGDYIKEPELLQLLQKML